MNQVFRPQQFNNKFKLGLSHKAGVYNWRPRRGWTMKNYLHHVFGILHYRSSHAPLPIQKRWRIAARHFESRHRNFL